MKKLFPISLTAVLIFAVILSGCGGGNGNGHSNDDGGNFSITESLVPATNTTSFPTGTDDKGPICNTITYPYYMAKYDVTYQLWSSVYAWATDNARGTNKYTFTSNAGGRGGYSYGDGVIPFTSGHETNPVTDVNWYDAIVWCNALTEYYNAQNKTSLGCVYKDTVGNVIRDSASLDSRVICDGLSDFDHSAKGFRLPTSMEWELAARWRTDSTNTVAPYTNPYFTTGNSASGATDFAWDNAANQSNTNLSPTQAVAWYAVNARTDVSHPNWYLTQPVGKKTANSLDIYDMSGNVSQWCFDKSGTGRVFRGGSWYEGPNMLQVGGVSIPPPDSSRRFIGFRVVRTP